MTMTDAAATGADPASEAHAAEPLQAIGAVVDRARAGDLDDTEALAVITRILRRETEREAIYQKPLG